MRPYHAGSGGGDDSRASRDIGEACNHGHDDGGVVGGVDGLVLLRVVVAGRLWRQRRRDLNTTAAPITHCGWNSTRALTCLIDTALTQLFIDLLYSHARLAEQIAQSSNVDIEMQHENAPSRSRR